MSKLVLSSNHWLQSCDDRDNDVSKEKSWTEIQRCDEDWISVLFSCEYL